MAQFLQASYPYDDDPEKDAVHAKADSQISDANWAKTVYFDGEREDESDMQSAGIQIVVL